MHPADEYASLKQQIKTLETRASRLRAQFLSGQAPQRSNAHEVVVKSCTRRCFRPDLLPAQIRDDPRYWETRVSKVVTVRSHAGRAPRPVSRDDDEFEVIEPYEFDAPVTTPSSAA